MRDDWKEKWKQTRESILSQRLKVVCWVLSVKVSAFVGIYAEQLANKTRENGRKT